MKLYKASVLLLAILVILFRGPEVAMAAEEDPERGDRLPDQTDAETEEAEEFVDRLYDYCLGRKPDEEGLSNWTELLLNNEVGGCEVAHGFFDSDEFISMDLSDVDFITVCYNVLLDRDPDPAGLAYWLQLLESGEKTRDGVIDMFCVSEEYEALCARYGIMNKIPTARDMYPEACVILDQCGWDLRSAYLWTRDSITYVRDINVDSRYTTRQLAHRAFSQRDGNCFVFSAAFTELACALGYNAHQMSGCITRSTGEVVPHSWVEIDIDGETFAFDPEFEYVAPSYRNGWYFRYGRAGTFVYQNGTRMD